MFIAHGLKYFLVQGSILSSLLFNIFTCQLFMLLPKDGVAYYADDDNPYSTGSGIHSIISIQNMPQAFCQFGLLIIIQRLFRANIMSSSVKHLILKLIVENVQFANSSCEDYQELKQIKEIPLNHMLIRFVKTPVKNTIHCHGWSLL